MIDKLQGDKILFSQFQLFCTGKSILIYTDMAEDMKSEVIDNIISTSIDKSTQGSDIDVEV